MNGESEWAKETVKEKHRGSLLPVSFTTEPWLSSQESIPPVAQQPGNNGMRDRDARGWSHPHSLPPHLPLLLGPTLATAVKKGEWGYIQGFLFFEGGGLPQLKYHFFPLSLGGGWGNGAGGTGVCHSTDGALFWLWSVCCYGRQKKGRDSSGPYIRLVLKLQWAWSSHGPCSSRDWQSWPTLPCYYSLHRWQLCVE